MHVPQQKIRNFSIIAHIDHGKTTLSDRLLEQTQTVFGRDMKAQLLDDMEIEQERGITIKSHPVTMMYTSEDGESYQINFIDTPGHVDFSYEVSRSLSACEGALLIVDAAQGVQAQTLANVHMALDKGLEIAIVINKIDLPAADPERVKQQIEEVIGISSKLAICCSAKTGEGVKEILDEIVFSFPPPKEPKDERLSALIFDSHYDTYRGAMAYIRIMSGRIQKGDLIEFMATGKSFEVGEVGIFSPNEKPVDYLAAGEVGYLVANIKNTTDVKIGDTVTHAKHKTDTPLPGFQVIKPVVFAGIYPVDTTEYEALTDALKKLQLNDSSLHVEADTSAVLGLGFRCGFLGLLHLEIIFERLSREYDLAIITTSPSVQFKIFLANGTMEVVDNPSAFPDPARISYIEEP